MRIDLTDQVHIITGAGHGIGQATARAIAEAGGVPIVVDRDEAAGEAVAQALRDEGLRAQAQPADVTDADRVKELVRGVSATHGRLDGLVNNAGTNRVANLVMTKDADFAKIMAVNFDAAVRLTRLCLKPMIRAKAGRIVNVSSVAGKIGAAYTSAYAASKGAINAFTRSVALEVAKLGITVNAVCPWHVHTEHMRHAMESRAKVLGKGVDEYLEEIAQTNPQRRILEPQEVAATIVFLLSDHARGIHGQAINVCGGMVMGI